MPQVRKQPYTRPIPADATRTTMKIRRRGKEVEVPAVRFKGDDGRARTRPIVEAGKGAGTQYREESEAYYGRIHGKPVKLCTNKAAAETMLADKIREVERGEAGLVDAFSQAKKQQLSEHVEDFQKYLTGRGRSASHVTKTAERIRRVLLEGCGCAILSDIKLDDVIDWLTTQQEDQPRRLAPDDKKPFTAKEAAQILGVSADAVKQGLRRLGNTSPRFKNKIMLNRETLQALLDRQTQGMGEVTANHYRTALRLFGSWLVGRGRRSAVDPFAELDNVRVDEIRRRRRVLSPVEMLRLVQAARMSMRVFRGLTGYDRGLLYAMVYYTGFRAAGIAGITPECFRLDDDYPSVTLPIRSDKSRRGKVNALHDCQVEPLRLWLASKSIAMPVWPGTWSGDGRAADMLRVDLGEAGIPFELLGPNGMEVLDFHALRHAAVTSIRRSLDASPVQQELAGHSSPTVTARYHHVSLAELHREVNLMPAVLPGAYLPLTFASDGNRRQAMVTDGDETIEQSQDRRRKPFPGKAIDGNRWLETATDGILPRVPENPKRGISVPRSSILSILPPLPSLRCSAVFQNPLSPCSQKG